MKKQNNSNAPETIVTRKKPEIALPEYIMYIVETITNLSID